MGKTLAPGTGLDSRQEQFLAVVLQDPFILDSFYLTGGTALSSWYLHHRASYDLDFFAKRGEPNPRFLMKWFDRQKSAIGYRKVHHENQFGFHFFTLIFPKGETLKVDFSYYPSMRLKRGLLWKGLSIDSLHDIAVNKFQTIASGPRLRDYIDLYCILQKEPWSIGKLRKDAAVKFGILAEPLHVAKQLLRVSEFTDLPTMLVPFNRKKMEEFFLQLAASLKSEILTA